MERKHNGKQYRKAMIGTITLALIQSLIIIKIKSQLGTGFPAPFQCKIKRHLIGVFFHEKNI